MFFLVFPFENQSNTSQDIVRNFYAKNIFFFDICKRFLKNLVS